VPKNKPNGSGTKAEPKPTFRSRVTAGLTLLPSVDGRSHWARIMRDTYLGLLTHAGGADYVSETKRLMARRVAACEAELIHLEDKFATIRTEGGEPKISDLDVYGRLAGQQRRCLEALGWDRTPRDVTPPPDLDTYLAYKRDAEDAEEVA
jgi:hypothetical protein